MEKYVVEFQKSNGAKVNYTFDKESRLLQFVKMSFTFGINELKIKKFEITEK